MSLAYNPGNYIATVSDQAFWQSSNGNPQVVLRVVIEDELHIEGGEETTSPCIQSLERTIYLTVTEKSKDMVLKKLRYAGFESDRFEDMNLIGAAVRVVCRHEIATAGSRQGQMVEKWDLMLPPGERLEHDPKVARNLNALFGKQLKDTAKKPAPKPTSQMVADDSPGLPEEDGIPF